MWLALNGKNIKISLPDMAKEIVLFMLVCISLLLWQSIFELIFDARFAIGMILLFVLFNLYLGDVIFIGELDEKWQLIAYVNLGMMARSSTLQINDIIAYLEVMMICVLQILGLRKALHKKDILSCKK